MSLMLINSPDERCVQVRMEINIKERIKAAKQAPTNSACNLFYS
jgi:hypothetical protein